MTLQDAPRAYALPDGRMRLTHGPIDLVITAIGDAGAVGAAMARARAAFHPILHELAAELPRLRHSQGADPAGKTAKSMCDATRPFQPQFITPMAAVAGAVADYSLRAMLAQDHGLSRAIVNNGGDIALWQISGEMTLAICENPIVQSAGATAKITARSGIHGVATSGWRGRSHSLGIADAVTVLAKNAATADAAATLIANAVNLPYHPAITRQPACDLSPDSDLGARPVTTNVGVINAADTATALAAGRALAQNYVKRGLVIGVCLALNGQREIAGSAIESKEPAHA